MRTRVTIMGLVLAIFLGTIAVLVALILWLGPWTGLVVGVATTALVVATYLLAIGPWQHRWGATDEEIARSMPGDGLVPGSKSTTRAITIAARPADVWPWLVQIGYGRGGWYSYDWIDNDGMPSAERILPELQGLKVGDRIQMAPGMGPTVLEIEPGSHFVAAGEADSWCLAVYPAEAGTRLVSRWRQNWPYSAATVFWTAISDPGAFVMERRMLKGVKARAEASESRS